MEESRIKRVVLKQEGFEIEIERETDQAPAALAPHYVQPAVAPLHQPHAESKPKLVESALPAESKPKAGSFVTSPMVGTFYASPSPDDPPFVKVGDSVNENSVVCIIEAMKVMNEVKSGLTGVVAEVLMKSGDPVEFGTRILRIEPT